MYVLPNVNTSLSFTACTIDALDYPVVQICSVNAHKQLPSTHIIDVVRHPGVTPPIAASSDHIFVYDEASYTCMGFKA